MLDSQIEAAAVAVWNSLQSCADLTVESLSDPQSRVLMPWPTVLRPQSDRMSMVANKYIYVDGREFFRDLYRHVMTNRKELRVNLMGTKGIGKSYRLAALAGLLLKKVCLNLVFFTVFREIYDFDVWFLVLIPEQGIRVVYLPNCGGSSNTLVADLRSALLVAFGDMGSLSIRQQIAKLQTAEQLGTFCNSQPPESLTFVFDQFNGVQEDSAAEILYIVGEKNFARKFLTQVRSHCVRQLCVCQVLSPSHIRRVGYWYLVAGPDFSIACFCVRILGEQLHCSQIGQKAAVRV